VRQKVRRLDSADCAFDQATKLLALFVGDGGAQVLNLDQALADKDDLGDVGDTGYPRVADQLRIQRQQCVWFFRVPTGRRLPLEQAGRAVKCPNGIDIGDEVVPSANGPGELDLQIALRPGDLDAIVLAEPG